MTILITILIIIILLLIPLVVYLYYKIKEIQSRMEYNQNIINESINNKCKIINNINKTISKKLDKDYLKEYVNLDNKSLSKIELDNKLNECELLINNLTNDIKDIQTKKFNDLIKELNRNNEILITSKKLYNKYAEKNNKLVKLLRFKPLWKIFKLNITAHYNI